MKSSQLKNLHVAKNAMLIRRPIDKVFEAFVDPKFTTKFWFSKGSDKLEAGKQVQWEWEMYGISIPVSVKRVEKNQQVVIEWPGPHGLTTVEWTFEAMGPDATFVRIKNDGFSGTEEEIVQQTLDSTQGFALVLAGAKAFLEHGIELNLIADRFPKGIEEH